MTRFSDNTRENAPPRARDPRPAAERKQDLASRRVVPCLWRTGGLTPGGRSAPLSIWHVPGGATACRRGQRVGLSPLAVEPPALEAD
jgi:hypothetical protein